MKMCIAIYKPETKLISKKTLQTCWKNNQHGAGYAYALNNKLIIRKGFMKFEHFWRSYKEIQQYSCIIHFRISTCGGITKENTHPFKVNSNVAMVHNGMLPIDDDPDKKLSDTALFCKNTLGHLPENFLEYPGILDMIEVYMESYPGGYKNKIIFLDNTGKVVILGGKHGYWVDNCWYSNDSYMETKRSSLRGYKHPLINPVPSAPVDHSKKISGIREYIAAHCPNCLEPLTMIQAEDYYCPECEYDFDANQFYFVDCVSCGRTFSEDDLSSENVCTECLDDKKYYLSGMENYNESKAFCSGNIEPFIDGKGQSLKEWVKANGLIGCNAATIEFLAKNGMKIS
jgi:hypothetical protein